MGQLNEVGCRIYMFCNTHKPGFISPYFIPQTRIRYQKTKEAIVDLNFSFTFIELNEMERHIYNNNNNNNVNLYSAITIQIYSTALV